MASLLTKGEDFFEAESKGSLVERDLNTLFFHATTTGRRKTNKMEKVEIEGGAVISTQRELCAKVQDYFDTLFVKLQSIYDPIPTSMTDWRPISLCNVLYMTVSKVLDNRIEIGYSKFCIGVSICCYPR